MWWVTVALLLALLAPQHACGEARLPVHRILQYDHAGKALGSRKAAINRKVRASAGPRSKHPAAIDPWGRAMATWRVGAASGCDIPKGVHDRRKSEVLPANAARQEVGHRVPQQPLSPLRLQRLLLGRVHM